MYFFFLVELSMEDKRLVNKNCNQIYKERFVKHFEQKQKAGVRKSYI